MGGLGCSFCELRAEHDPSHAVPVGSANLWVPGDGILYVAPELVIHYIEAHHYRPPEPFVRAVRRCPTEPRPLGDAFLAAVDASSRDQATAFLDFWVGKILPFVRLWEETMRNRERPRARRWLP